MLGNDDWCGVGGRRGDAVGFGMSVVRYCYWICVVVLLRRRVFRGLLLLVVMMMVVHAWTLLPSSAIVVVVMMVVVVVMVEGGRRYRVMMAFGVVRVMKGVTAAVVRLMRVPHATGKGILRVQFSGRAHWLASLMAGITVRFIAAGLYLRLLLTVVSRRLHQRGNCQSHTRFGF